MSRFPSAQETAFADFVNALRTYALEAEVEIHQLKAEGIVADLASKLEAIRGASPPPPGPQMAKVVPLDTAEKDLTDMVAAQAATGGPEPTIPTE